MEFMPMMKLKLQTPLVLSSLLLLYAMMCPVDVVKASLGHAVNFAKTHVVRIHVNLVALVPGKALILFVLVHLQGKGHNVNLIRPMHVMITHVVMAGHVRQHLKVVSSACVGLDIVVINVN